MNEYVIIIFGASGDLVQKKLLPALYSLIKKNNIEAFAVIGAAYDDISAQDILMRAKPHIHDLDMSIWQQLQERFFYQKLNFTVKNDYEVLHNVINTCKKRLRLQKADTLIYCATAASFFCDITRYCALSGIGKRIERKDSPWTRLVFEKPFGNDSASAHAINECIATYFNEDQIYRIDHYLTKELVGNIALVRFTNLVFEPLWSNRYIDQVQIVLSEKEDIGNRGQYYDRFGAISDVMQNHMLELLALVGMEAPKTLSGNHVRDERAKVLEKVKVIDAFFGQYVGYQKAPHVADQSQTETFAAVYLRIENKRWSGVPFYLKTGKCLSKKETVIHIKFKSVDCLLATCPISANILTIEIYPTAGFTLRLNAKKPGESHEVIPMAMEFCHSCVFGHRDEQAYQTLLEGVIKGEQSVSVRFDEIESAWKIIDNVKKEARPVYAYACGSDGPQEIEQFNKKHGIKWLS